MDSTNKFNSMTSDYVIVSIKLCPEAGNDKWFVLCNFIGCSISSFEVIGEGGRGGGLWGPSGGPRSREAKKNPVLIRLRTYTF